MLLVALLLGLSASRERPRLARKGSSNYACDMCTMIVSYVDQALKSGIVSEEVEDLVLPLCEKLPAPFNTVCAKFVDTFTQEVVALLEAGIESVEICSQFGFCGSVSSRKGARVGNAFTCSMCQTAVQIVETAMVSTTVESEVGALVNKVCAKLPDPYGSYCESMVNMSLPTIMGLIAQGIDSIDICTRVSACSTNATRPLRREKAPRVPQSTMCSMCETVVNFVVSKIGDSTEEQIIAGLDEVCNGLPFPINVACTKYVNTYAKQIIDEVRNGSDTELICKAAHFCSLRGKARLNKKVTGTVSCTICQTLVSWVEAAMVSDVVDDEIESVVTLACKLLPSPYNGLCSDYVYNYLPMIMEYLEQGLEHLAICKRINLCNDDTQTHVKKTRVGSFCDQCLSLMEYVGPLVNTTSDEDLMAEGKEYCNSLSFPKNLVCNSYLSKYFTSIVTQLREGVEYEAVCSNNGFCSTGNLARASKSSTVACTICHSIVQYVESLISSGTVESEIEQLVDLLCDQFPSPYSTVCESMVANYLPQIIELINQKVDALNICAKIKLCDSSSTATKARPVSSSKKSATDTCGICEMVVSFVEKAIRNGIDMDSIVENLDKMCKVSVPSALSPFCEAFISRYIQYIVDAINVSNINATAICSRINFCSGSKSARLTKKTSRYGSEVLCTICESIIKFIESELEDQTVDEAIESKLMLFCNFFETPYSSICQGFIKSYFPYLIEQIEAGIGYLEICNKLSMCTSSMSTLSSRRYKFGSRNHKLH